MPSVLIMYRQVEINDLKDLKNIVKWQVASLVI